MRFTYANKKTGILKTSKLNGYMFRISEGGMHPSAARGRRGSPGRVPQRDDGQGHRPSPLLSLRGVQVPRGGVSLPQGGAERTVAALHESGMSPSRLDRYENRLFASLS